jgi:hypothetical protein
MTNSKKQPKNQFTSNEVESALCVFEWLMGRAMPGLPKTGDEFDEEITKLFNDFGWSGMRSTAVQASVFVDQCWDWAEKHADFLTASSSYDWDFCPMICRRLDWPELAQNNQYGDGATLPDVQGFMAGVVAEHAMAKPKAPLAQAAAAAQAAGPVRRA